MCLRRVEAPLRHSMVKLTVSRRVAIERLQGVEKEVLPNPRDFLLGSKIEFDELLGREVGRAGVDVRSKSWSRRGADDSHAVERGFQFTGVGTGEVRGVGDDGVNPLGNTSVEADASSFLGLLL